MYEGVTFQHNGRIQLLDEATVMQLDDLNKRLQGMLFDAQLSIPDIVVWLISQGKRKAFLRIPVADLFCADGLGRGPQCGHVSTALMGLPSAGPKSAAKGGDIPAQLQYRGWFGPRDTQVRVACTAPRYTQFPLH
jgi:hypothetical protein